MIVATLLALTAATAGQNEPYTADLSKCLVAKTTETDRIALVKWVFAAVSASPAVADMTTLTPEQRLSHHRRTGELFTRLLSKDCRPEAVAALKYEGTGTIEKSFSVLGEVAMRGLMNAPTVVASLGEMVKFVDQTAIEAVGREAGMQAPAAKPAK